MNILVINPNSTAAMTRSIGEAARTAADSGTRITAINPDDAPPAIQGRADGLAALPALFELFDTEMSRGAYDACIIACFDDTGLMELKTKSPVPVMGIGEAAYHAAMMVGPTFSVVTTLGVSVPVLEDNLRRYGFASRCRRVRACEVPVLQLDADRDGSRETIAAEIALALRQDRPDAIALGCAGMADLAHEFTIRFGVPVIDGVATAVSFTQALCTGATGRMPRTS